MDDETQANEKINKSIPPRISQSEVLSKQTTSYKKDEDIIIHAMIEIHRKELEDIGTQLAKEARKRSKLSSSIKATVIFLGALVAVKEVANQLVGSSNTLNIIIFTVAGLLIAILTGIEATFKWGDTSAELKSLVASSRAASRTAASNLAKAYAIQDKEGLKELKKILDTLDNEIVSVQKRAATIGIETVMLNNAFKEQVSVSLESISRNTMPMTDVKIIHRLYSTDSKDFDTERV